MGRLGDWVKVGSAPNETVAIDGEIAVWWKNIDASEDGPKHLGINVEVFCWDSRGMRHQTRYKLFAFEPSQNMVTCDEIAPSVMLVGRTTTTRPVWWLKLIGKTRTFRRQKEAAEKPNAPEVALRLDSNSESSSP